MKDWKDYNRKLIKNSIEFINENKNCDIDENKVKILDYGSNTKPWSNIQKKLI